MRESSAFVPRGLTRGCHIAAVSHFSRAGVSVAGLGTKNVSAIELSPK
jgi:hypothetical protein